MRIKHSITLSLCTALLACAILTSCDEKEEGGGANSGDSGGDSAKKVDNDAVVLLGVNEDDLYGQFKQMCEGSFTLYEGRKHDVIAKKIREKYNICTGAKFDNAVKQKVYDDSVKKALFNNYKQEAEALIGDTLVFALLTDTLSVYDKMYGNKAEWEAYLKKCEELKAKGFIVLEANDFIVSEGKRHNNNEPSVTAEPQSLYNCYIESTSEKDGRQSTSKYYAFAGQDCNSYNKEYTSEEQAKAIMNGRDVPIETKSKTAATIYKDKYVLTSKFIKQIGVMVIIFPDQNSAMNFESKENDNLLSVIPKKHVMTPTGFYSLYEYVGPASEKATGSAAKQQASEQPAAAAAPAINTATDYSSALQTHFSKGTLGATGKTRPIEMFFQSVSKNGNSYSIKGKSKTKATEDAFNGSLSISSEETGGSCGGGEKEIKGTYDLNENESKTSGHFVGDFTACENNGKLSKANFVGNWVKHSNGNKTPCEFEL